MLKRQKKISIHKHHRFQVWKQTALIIALLFSGTSLATLVPSQAAYAHSSRSKMPHHSSHSSHKEHGPDTKAIKLLIVCKAGNGGKGGTAMHKSSGAVGGAGGNCNITVPIKVFVKIQHNTGHKKQA
jgi:hypothetical protein